NCPKLAARDAADVSATAGADLQNGTSKRLQTLRLVRSLTGSSSEAVLAAYVVASTNGSGGTPSACTRLYTMGASTTAVVSSENQTVTKTPMRYSPTYSRTPLPRLSRAV